ncbi:restriction endonuclease subunit S [Hymenobacter crusticola]|uniref:Type I restriction modification DNA specificity domain-containing protein n=1 Tax=Hymenobacter crusticola TaxID=1770526 RepID=A0A243W605_9BACT|nr:restriction endonuclease subunit S [Hymenobacter crusticola]OUJ69397.1 hypothetical protein BXP70_26535 [Hymenobacter crusticola]
MSEAMELPEGWRKVKLGEIGQLSGGGTPSTKDENYWNGGIPWLTPNEVTKSNSLFVTSTQRTISEIGLKNSSARLQPVGTVMLTSRATIGEVAINTVPMATNQGFINVICDSEFVFNEFLAHWMAHNKEIFIERAHGAIFKEITKSNFKVISIILPPLPEQRAIAEVLGSVQAALAARRREQQLEQEYKAALLEHLFTRSTRGGETRETEIGEVPMGWEVTTLKKVFEGGGKIQTGPFGSQLHAYDYLPEGIPVLNPTHLGANTINKKSVPRISQEKAKELTKHFLKEGDILISRRGDFSHYAYITPDFSGGLCGTGCLLLRIQNPEIDNYYVSVWLGMRVAQDYLRKNAVGTVMPNLNTSILNSIPMLIPPLPEQQRIAAVLGAVDEKLGALATEVARLEELFRALLEELLSGRMRTRALSKEEN